MDLRQSVSAGPDSTSGYNFVKQNLSLIVTVLWIYYELISIGKNHKPTNQRLGIRVVKKEHK